MAGTSTEAIDRSPRGRSVAIAIALVVVVAAMVGAVVRYGREMPRTDGIRLDVGGTSVFAVERRAADSSGPAVLFLHGRSFTAEVWIETGLLDDVAAAGHDAIAVDLPGYGLTDGTDTSSADFLGALLAEVDTGEGVVVVAPSMSGSFLLPLLAARRTEHLAGVVPVAPVGVAEFVGVIDEPIEGVPALVVWGADDDVISPDGASVLASAFVESQVVVLDDAGHSAYRDDPAAFLEVLTAFVDDA